ncbi:MAG: heparan-alpha-glucosaminide N-acetyltransferase domain-containing protein [Promethearchaeota archaeon]
MKRLRSIDSIRGLCIFIMVFSHLLNWWVITDDYWIYQIFSAIFDDIAAAGFLFIAGVSTMISFRNRLRKTENTEDYTHRMVKIEYNMRALFIFIAALMYNGVFAIMTLNPLTLWTWFIPLTIAISLFLAYPLLKTSISFKILLGVIIWIINYFLSPFLLAFKGQNNIYGVLFYILYNSIDVHPILYYFSFFLIGTAVGEIIFEIYFRNAQKASIKNKFLLPSSILGLILIIFGILLLFPSFLIHATVSATIYSLGIVLLLFSVLLTLEEFEVTQLKKNFRFFFYYSYYSYTIYLTHNLLYFIFLAKLNTFSIWTGVVGTAFLLTLVIIMVFKKFGAKFSLKVQIGRLSLGIARIIEKRNWDRIKNK